MIVIFFTKMRYTVGSKQETYKGIGSLNVLVAPAAMDVSKKMTG